MSFYLKKTLSKTPFLEMCEIRYSSRNELGSLDPLRPGIDYQINATRKYLPLRENTPFNLLEIGSDLERRRRKFWGLGTSFRRFLRQKR